MERGHEKGYLSIGTGAAWLRGHESVTLGQLYVVHKQDSSQPTKPASQTDRVYVCQLVLSGGGVGTDKLSNVPFIPSVTHNIIRSRKTISKNLEASSKHAHKRENVSLHSNKQDDVGWWVDWLVG